ncbi:DEAD/DEAH box helicase [Candidatus Daviesbacteria bacterium]|nr:DEAD/DEAH box helicase [Candidatus Daviesbacteria bacterium]
MYYNERRFSTRNKPKGFRSSVRRGDSFKNKFRRPFSNGGFNKPRFQSRGAHESKLKGQLDIFIKKAKEITEIETVFQQTFSDFNLINPLKINIQEKGYITPTPIQQQAIPAILEGRDLIGLANTGTGKTAAFLIPIISKIFQDRSKRAFIITPTRELAVQINDELRAFSKNMSIYSALLIGGSNMHRQISDLKRFPNVIIGTPGRLKDLIQRRMLNLNDFSIFVLDEVDLMVDIGFINDVKYFVSFLPKVRQSLFFSATISPKVREVLQYFVQNPVTVSVKIQDTAENVDQDVIRVQNGDSKINKLHDLLIKEGFEKVLIFGKTKHGIEKLNKQLQFRGFKVGSIHGNKRQSQRERVLQSFKSDQINILLATDVASRGLDIPDVSHVINYDLPQTYDDYIHRIGRTGRANKKGTALTFVE